MEFLASYGMFLAKAVTIVIAFAIVLALILSGKQRGSDKGHIEVTKLNDTFDEYSETIKLEVLDSAVLKLEQKLKKKKEKQLQKDKKRELKAAGNKSDASPASDSARKRIFVLNFDGDIKASANASLREEITAVLGVATERDEVVVNLESGGGMVHSYGLAASQLTRFTERKIPLTVCVDKVAASGGYMMACVADKIVAAPFAVLGSIGVVAQLPNFHRLLKKNDIDYEMFTAGEYKRTVTMFGENTDKGREKFTDDLEQTHVLFKAFVNENRPAVDVDKVATGEIWYGSKALEMQLIDQIQTSDGYLWAQHPDSDIFLVEFAHKKSLPERLGVAAELSLERMFSRLITLVQPKRWF
ncbi:protease SohB [Gilvimarinus polysaccharolyticus]|uniref:protease SohB n=1 Tax=Gilvimarinus polysaccharolyticus TaxID=863921 RepID=UPI000673929B|nr:protease SohB [Gilvimarinus polysaccharolyticus]